MFKYMYKVLWRPIGSVNLNKKEEKKMSTNLQNIPNLENTFLSDLLQTIENGYVYEGEMEEVEEGEEIVGEMNDLEKALNFLRHKYNEVGAEAEAHLHDNPKEKIKEAATCFSRGEIADGLMWDSIRSRLGEDDKPMVVYSIKSGHKIIKDETFNNMINDVADHMVNSILLGMHDDM